jgi:hypothetical protein
VSVIRVDCTVGILASEGRGRETERDRLSRGDGYVAEGNAARIRPIELSPGDGVVLESDDCRGRHSEVDREKASVVEVAVVAVVAGRRAGALPYIRKTSAL